MICQASAAQILRARDAAAAGLGQINGCPTATSMRVETDSMEQALLDFKNLVVALIDLLPPDDSPQYWAIVAGLSALLALLLLSLLTRRRNQANYGTAHRPHVDHVSFDPTGGASTVPPGGKPEPRIDQGAPAAAKPSKPAPAPKPSRTAARAKAEQTPSAQSSSRHRKADVGGASALS